MSSLQKIAINFESIGKVLSTMDLAVPIYQRSYSWKDEQVEAFYYDILECLRSEKSEYFLGTVVATGGQGALMEVVDGQQRLATCTIILACIRDILYEKNERDRASTIEASYLFKRDLRTLDLTPKLRLSAIDNDYFIHTILNGPDHPDKNEAPSKTSHNRIQNAYKLLKTKLVNWANGRSDPVLSLIDWEEFIRTGLKVVLVSVADDADAFTIFETLNDRGIELAITDLLKNYLFGLAGNRIDEVQQSWTAMRGALEAIAESDLSLPYIRHYWSSKHGVTRERELYASIKKAVSTKSAAIALAKDLETSARTYAAILNPDHDYWNDFPKSVQKHIYTLNLLGAVQIRPLLISILDTVVDHSKIDQMLQLCVSFTVRFMVQGTLGSGALEENYCRAAEALRRGSINTARDLARQFAAINPSDLEFKKAFSEATISKSALARYYLIEIEKARRGDATELVPNDDPAQVNLEHIMPVKPSAGWDHVTPEEHKAYVRRLGNMTLLRSKLNAEIRSGPFHSKKPTYADSDFLITKELDSVETWGIEQIQERQKSMAEAATGIWAT